MPSLGELVPEFPPRRPPVVRVSATLALLAVSAGANPAPLFASRSPLTLTLSADFRALSKVDEQGEVHSRPGRLEYADGEGRVHGMDVKVQPRGVFRLEKLDCRYPNLFLSFESDAAGTPFAGQRTVPVVTHCKSKTAFVQYLLSEYLVYRTYNVLTPKSLAVRLARVTYAETSGKWKPVTAYAFFVEHFDELAARLDGEVVEIDRLYPLDAEDDDTALMELFQYMIGHTDWSLVYQHNVVLIRTRDGRIIPVPFDFDSAGVIDAEYAGPSPNLPIRSVRQRLFRGMCRPDAELASVYATLMAARTAIYALYETQEGLSGRTRKRALAYYDRFYDIIASPEKREAEIEADCRMWKRERTPRPGAREG